VTDAELDPKAMVERFRQRAAAVRSRGMPPVEGPERRRIIEQAKVDYMDFAILGDADAEIEDGILTFRIDLRPAPEDAEPEGAEAAGDEAPQSGGT
jgi:hypothetical protein